MDPTFYPNGSEKANKSIHKTLGIFGEVNYARIRYYYISEALNIKT
jgi:hypothetical protein